MYRTRERVGSGVSSMEAFRVRGVLVRLCTFYRFARVGHLLSSGLDAVWPYLSVIGIRRVMVIWAQGMECDVVCFLVHDMEMRCIDVG